jgi:hypothetical protein
MITKSKIAKKLLDYLESKITLTELVDWAEETIREGDFAEENNNHNLRDIVARIGLDDVKAFGLEWEDHREMLNQLGYRARIVVQPQ